MTELAFLGLGVMGAPMAGHLQGAGHDVTVFNRTESKAKAWAQKYSGAAATTPREAALGADFVMACVGNDDDLRSVCLGADGAFSGMSKGSVFVDHTTVSAKVTAELYAAAAEVGNILYRRPQFQAVKQGLRTPCCLLCAALMKMHLIAHFLSWRSIPRFAVALELLGQAK